MNIIQTDIPDVLIIKPQVYADERGFFFESYHHKAFSDATGLNIDFVQDNHSRSGKGVLRGLHYQLPPSAQGKLVRCIVGEIFDVAVDIRKSSATFGQWVGQVISAENKMQLWVPEGFAHGFLVLSETAEVLYKTTNYYAPELERCIHWEDQDISINWPKLQAIHLSDKDRQASVMIESELFD